MAYVSLGRFSLIDNGLFDQPYWRAPSGVTAMIDLVPPGKDSDPDVNFALMLSDEPLDEVDCHYSFGNGNVTEMQLDVLGQSAWESITGYRPQQTTLAEVLAQHLLTGSDPTGEDFTRPLTAGFNRGLEIHLGGEIWSYTLTGLSDPLALPVMRVEAESLATIYREEGETQYRLAMGGLRRKYATRPIKELITYLFPSGRDDLPLMDELSPQTIKTETWPTLGAITSGQDNIWSVLSGSFSVIPSGTLTATTSNTGYCLLGYTFGGADRLVQWVLPTNLGLVGSCAIGVQGRSDAAGTTAYLQWFDGPNLEVYKLISGTGTLLVSVASVVTPNAAFYASVVGSTLITKIAGVQRDSRTDTAVSTGTRSTIHSFYNGITQAMLVGPLSIDDLISGGGPFPHFIRRRMNGGLLSMNGGL